MAQWPGGCGHRFHERCMAQMYAHSEHSFCPLCNASPDGTHRPTPCVHGANDQCIDGCGERCFHNCWTGVGACAACANLRDNREALNSNVSDNDERCSSLTNEMKRELERLAATGMEPGYTWSSILGPFIWTSLSCTTIPAGLTLVRLWGLAEVREEFVQQMKQRILEGKEASVSKTNRRE